MVFGEAAGVMLVLVLAGLVVPIGLLFTALAFDAIVVLWAAFQAWHDRVWPAMARVWQRSVHMPHWRLHPR